MRCLACGADMILLNVVRDDTMPVAGFEHHTFMCSQCHDVERRLAFNKPSEQEPAPVEMAPPLAPALAPTLAPLLAPPPAASERPVVRGLFARVLAHVPAKWIPVRR
jgi:hypothetical protein